MGEIEEFGKVEEEVFFPVFVRSGDLFYEFTVGMGAYSEYLVLVYTRII